MYCQGWCALLDRPVVYWSGAMFVLQLLMFGPNQYFAENALLGNYTYRASAVAKGRVTVLRTSCEDFNMVCNLTPQHGSTFLAWEPAPSDL